MAVNWVQVKLISSCVALRKCATSDSLMFSSDDKVSSSEGLLKEGIIHYKLGLRLGFLLVNANFKNISVLRFFLE